VRRALRGVLQLAQVGDGARGWRGGLFTGAGISEMKNQSGQLMQNDVAPGCQGGMFARSFLAAPRWTDFFFKKKKKSKLWLSPLSRAEIGDAELE